jgi:hypothetical protein
VAILSGGGSTYLVVSCTHQILSHFIPYTLMDGALARHRSSQRLRDAVTSASIRTMLIAVSCADSLRYIYIINETNQRLNCAVWTMHSCARVFDAHYVPARQDKQDKQAIQVKHE